MTLTFRPLCQEDRAYFSAYAQGHLVENSELTYSNTFLWEKAWGIQVCRTEEALFLQAQLPDGERCYLQPLVLRDEDMGKALDALVQDALERGLPFLIKGAILSFVEAAKAARPGMFAFAHDRDNDEYLYDRDKLATLTGSKYHQKRNHLNRFHAQYAFTYEPLSAAHREECLALFDRWEAAHAQTASSAERWAIERALAAFEELGLAGAALRINGQLRAFSVGERLTERVALIHMEKADDALIPELFALINQQTAEHVFPDAAELNREEDMGLPGLRKAKLSYHPLRMIEKYDITLPGGDAQ